ncbi:MAG: OmpA family protein [Bacteroidales bacterium]|nr:OmpA family protein [Bacteroidales bacterium]
MRYFLPAMILLGLCFSTAALGQRKEIRKAKAAFDDEDWYHCTVYYDDAVKLGATLGLDDRKKVARSLFELNQVSKAWEIYSTIEDNLTGEDIYFYAKTLHRFGLHADAIDWYDKAKKAGAVGGKIMQVNDMIASCRWAIANEFSSVKGVVVNPDRSVLEVNQSFGIQIYNGKVVYSYAPENSDKKDKNGNPFLNLYTQDFVDGHVVEGKPQVFSPNLRSEYHVGAISFTSDKKHIFLTKTVYVNKEPRIKIFVADFDGRDWVNERLIEFDSDEYDFAHPAVSLDDKYLYFVSNMPDHTKIYGKDVKNYGGKDIYRAEFSSDVNHFKKVENLGTEVNTYGDEVYPVINPDGKLYFSSDTRNGFGGLDIFCSEYIDGKWQNTRNMLKAFNGAGDDFYYLMFSADKPDGFLSRYDFDKDRDMFMDVMTFEVSNEPLAELPPVFGAEGVIIPPDQINEVAHESKAEMMDLSTLITSTYNNEIIEGAKFTITDEETEDEFAKALSGVDGKVTVSFALTKINNGREVVIEVSKSGFNTKTIQVTEDELADIAKEGIKLTPIFNDAVLDDISGMVIPYQEQLDDAAKQVLDKLASYLINAPQVTVKLNAHTEAKGNRYENLNISQKMADASKDYLVAKGVNPKQLIPRGYGERYLLNRCHRGVYCDASKHKVNRRIEVVVWHVAK